MNEITKLYREKIYKAIELEEMDWQQTKKAVENQLREALLQVEMHKKLLETVNLRLMQIFEVLPDDEKMKRTEQTIPSMVLKNA